MRTIRKILACILSLTLALSVCGPAAAFAEEKDEENYETGDASLDDPRNADKIGENELLVVSFGTSYNDSRRLTIGAIESDLQAAFPPWSARSTTASRTSSCSRRT